MVPLVDWPIAERRDIIGVFTDIDDTLTTHGAITPDALAALAALQSAGLQVIPITGRPVGWSEPFALGDATSGLPPWPVDAIVAENGAVALVQRKTGQLLKQEKHNQLSKIYQQDAATRASNYARMQRVAQVIMAEVAGAQLSQDSPGRETDIAIDHSEFTHLSAGQIAQVVAIMQAHGMVATVSSIHINGWFGAHNKLEGARWIVRQLFNRDLDAERDRWVYVGDSTNDELMFAAFRHSVGVANIARFLPQLQTPPRYVSHGERGAGFAEVAQAILAARNSDGNPSNRRAA